MKNQTRFVIRRAELRDLDELVLLEDEAFEGDEVTRRAFRRALVSPWQTIFVADDRAHPIGFALVRFSPRHRHARVYSLVVAKAHQRQGVGRGLLETVEGDCQKRGAEDVRLEVRTDNQQAYKLYQDCGYSVFDQMENYYDDGCTALRMRKQIDNK